MKVGGLSGTVVAAALALVVGAAFGVLLLDRPDAGRGDALEAFRVGAGGRHRLERLVVDLETGAQLIITGEESLLATLPSQRVEPSRR